MAKRLRRSSKRLRHRPKKSQKKYGILNGFKYLILAVIIAFIGYIISWNSHVKTLTAKEAAALPYSTPLVKKEKVPKEYSKVSSLLRSSERLEWFIKTKSRISDHRLHDLVIVLKNKNGSPIDRQKVHITLDKHEFHHGGVMNIWQFSGERKTGKPYIDPTIYKEKFLELFNAGGFNNAFKFKLQRNHASLLPQAINWYEQKGIHLRGHTLIWPGERHLPKEILGVLDNNELLRQKSCNMVRNWAKKWQIKEWDVINEPRANHLIQDKLGKNIEVDWFKIAKEASAYKDVKLYLNDYQIVSGTKDQFKDIYEENVQMLLDRGAPLNGLGVQSRFKFDRSPKQIHDALDRLAKFNLPIKGTEFEVVDLKRKLTDQQRAKITLEVASSYFGHPHVNGLYVWTIFQSSHDAIVNGKPSWGHSSFMIEKDGSLKPNGLVWKYLFKHLWSIDSPYMTDIYGAVKIRAYRGDYSIKLLQHGKTITRQFKVTKNNLIEITL